MSVLNKMQKQWTKLFANAADVAGLLMAFIYIAYVGLLMLFSGVQTWLNYCMLGITAAYFIFLMIKVFFINGRKPKKKLKKFTKFVYRYAKLAMRITNAVLVVLSIVNRYRYDLLDTGNMVSMIGVIVLVITLIISVAWDVVKYFLSKRLREIMSEWKALESSQKKEKLDFFIDSIIKTLDNVSGFDYYVEAGVRAGQLVGGRFKNNKGEGGEEGPLEGQLTLDEAETFVDEQIAFGDAEVKSDG